MEDADAGIEAAKAGGFYAVGIGGAAENVRADFTISAVYNLLYLSVICKKFDI